MKKPTNEDICSYMVSLRSLPAARPRAVELALDRCNVFTQSLDAGLARRSEIASQHQSACRDERTTGPRTSARAAATVKPS